ncbi:MAG: aromatic amino acid lyase, partial [Candidatus Rokuibacteriota bacterium]
MIELDGGALALEAVEAVARHGEEVRLAPAVARVLGESRAFVERLAAGVEPIYGITTGVGKLKDVVIPPDQRAELQRNLVLSHAGGMGAPLATAEVRAIMLLLAASLARGASGVRPVVVETVIACLNRRVHPVVPELGSVGASGDLAP